MKNIQAKLLKHRNIMLGIVAFVSVFALTPAHLVLAGNDPVTDTTVVDDDFGLDPLESLTIKTDETDARVVIIRIINLALTFLGLIAVILILWGGFKWMTAGGNDESVEAAKKIIIAAVIGLAIILSAYAIANFFISSIGDAIDPALLG